MNCLRRMGIRYRESSGAGLTWPSLSVLVEKDAGVAGGGSASRKDHGGEGRKRDEGGSEPDGKRVAWGDAMKLSLKGAPEGNRACEPGGDADDDHPCALSEEVANDSRGGGPEGHADGDFTLALPDGKGDEAVDAEDGETRGEDGERAEQRRKEAWAGEFEAD